MITQSYSPNFVGVQIMPVTWYHYFHFVLFGKVFANYSSFITGPVLKILEYLMDWLN